MMKKGKLLTKVKRSSGRLYLLKLNRVENCLQTQEDIFGNSIKGMDPKISIPKKKLSTKEMIRGLSRLKKFSEIVCIQI